MTGQAHDRFLYKEKEYSIVPKLVDINSLGLYPISENTACWRGYVASFGLLDGKLVLKEISTNNGNHENEPAPAINGVKPKIFSFSGSSEEFRHFQRLEYTDINLPIDFTGTLTLTDDLIWERYIHMGYQDELNFRIVIDLVFENGDLKSEKDRSEEMEKRRASGETKPDWLRDFTLRQKDK